MCVRPRPIGPAMARNPLAPGLLSLVIIVVIIFFPPALIGIQLKDIPFDPEPLEKLKKAQPAYVILGNSASMSRIDTELLTRLLGGKKVYSQALFGDMSAMWYLNFKNLVIPARIQPRRVFIFFTNNDLTMPMKRTAELKYRQRIARVSMAREVYMEKVFNHHRGVTGRVGVFFEKMYPVQDHYDNVPRWYINKLSYLFALPGIKNRKDGQDPDMEQQKTAMHERIDQTFDLHALRESSQKNLMQMNLIYKWDYLDQPAEWLDFNARLEYSFLPEIIRLARENGIDLGFVFYQRRPDEQGRVTLPEALERYKRDLFAYFTKKGLYYYDFSGDPEVTRDLYSSTVHIGRQNKQRYTHIFHRRVTGPLNDFSQH